MWAVASIWVFSARGRFAAKCPTGRIRFSWISLDSLVRIETFQWVARVFRRRTFSRAEFPAIVSRATTASLSACGTAWLLTGESLPQFLVFRNNSSSGHVSSGQVLSGSGGAQRPARGGCLQFVIPAQAGI